MKDTYMTPALIELGAFVDETGNTGQQNGEEWWWPFDEWH